MSATPVDIVRQATLDVRPMSGHTGAEIFGADLAGPLDADSVGQIRAALLQWKVVFFRDQHLTPEQHIALGRQFGQVTPAHPTLPAAFPEYPEILRLDSKPSGGARRRQRADAGWHTDVTFVTNPPMGSILRAVVVPPYGGDTQWSNLAEAYAQLSEPVQELIDRLQAVHHNVLAASGEDPKTELQKAMQSKDVRSVHPVVRIHPETGEKTLFVNPVWTSHVIGVSRREGRHLLAMLYEHLADPVFTVRFRWQPGSIAFWDNRATAHLVPGDVPDGMHRSMQRITLAGDTPVGPDGFTSYSISGDSFS